MENSYEYVIIGAGISSLNLALLLSRINKKVLILEKNDRIGGNHSSYNKDGFFFEHGPRIYIDNYLNFKEMLKLMNSDFNDFFIKSKFSIFDFSKQALKFLKVLDIIKFSIALLTLSKKDKKKDLLAYCKKKKFTEKAIDYFDKICRLSDGGNIENFTLYEFLQIINQNILYKTFQPKFENNLGFLKCYEDFLINNGVVIKLNSQIINIDDNQVKDVNNNIHYFKNLIITIPPFNFFNKEIFIPKKNINIDEFINKTNYITYVNITFHFKENILQNRYLASLPDSDWFLAHVFLSDYINFNNYTVISSLICNCDSKSKVLDKTVNEISDKNIIIKEVFRQLNEFYNNQLPNYHVALLEDNFYDDIKQKWIPKNTAFMNTKYGFLENQTKIKNVYCCSTANGNSNYAFTSVESATQNAIFLFNKLYPENQIRIFKIVSMLQVLFIIFFILITSISLYLMFKLIIFLSNKFRKPKFRKDNIFTKDVLQNNYNIDEEDDNLYEDRFMNDWL
jgi:oxygen-dependent protoporphyrinogen oxidase